MRHLREKLTYANVMATAAVFIALGGTSYAVVSLPRNSVGRAQIRQHAVGAQELAPKAVTSRTIRDKSVALRDISTSARRALVGAVGPAGPKGDSGPAGVVLHAGMNSAGQLVRGNATAGANAPGEGVFTVEWAQDVSSCDASATLASAAGGAVVDPPAGRITVSAGGRGLAIHTFDVDGTPRDLPFAVLVAC
jgi:hypothetical protein